MRTLIKIFVLCTVLFFSAQLFAQSTPPSVEDEIIAVTYAAWKAQMEKNALEANKILADEYTEFNSEASTRLDGKEISVRLGDAMLLGSTKVISAEMLNPKVQVYGDVAILTYNYLGLNQDHDGKTTTMKAKSTRVYVKMNGNWMLVHANFASDPSTN
jgi:ketosteroid isomerase-like protein